MWEALHRPGCLWPLLRHPLLLSLSTIDVLRQIAPYYRGDVLWIVGYLATSLTSTWPQMPTVSTVPSPAVGLMS